MRTDMVNRQLRSIIEKYLFKNKTIIIYGARQTGKTTLLEMMLEPWRNETLFLNGDDADVRTLMTNINATRFIPVIGNARIVVLDEAQRIPEAGLALKVIHDNFKNVQLIATGSSSLELAGKINEPLTGRKYEFMLYPFSFSEMAGHHGFLNENRLLEHRMIYGYYPDIVLNPGQENKLLRSLASSYLYKDILSLETIKKPVLVEKIVTALALQIGKEVSYSELAQLVGSDKGTVEKYIDLLERSCIVFRLRAFTRNVRNEIRKSRKIYFYDNGIRNSVIGNFTPLDSRTDKGVLWENFLISERKKYLENNEVDTIQWFWRTTQQQELDYIEEYPSHLQAYEFKWNPERKANLSRTFSNAYPNHEFKVVNRDNFHEFLSQEESPVKIF
jgi:predicted AAA+ superfamily ATPase